MVLDTLDVRFSELTGHAPLAWQRRLYAQLVESDIPSACDLPTGLGKTSIMALWYLARQENAALPRRLVYVVDRRAVVDQATEEAEKIKKSAGDPDLRISTLRGQFTDNREWLEDPAATAIIVGTVDMIGSRLLFEGYGVSRRMRPYHAGLLGADTLVLVDESHLVPPFLRLLERVADANDLGPAITGDDGQIPPLRVLPLSATGASEGAAVFRLSEEDREDAIVARRLDAEKLLTFAPVGTEKIEELLAEKAWLLAGNGTAPARVLVYCNSRDTAAKTKTTLEKRAKPLALPEGNIQLFVGARRVHEREKTRNALADLGFFSGAAPPEKPAFVIATSAGEVGVDLDADHMVMDLAPFERMVQRLGRVNRLGGEDRAARVVILETSGDGLPDDLKARAGRAAELLRGIPDLNASPGTLARLKEQQPSAVADATTPEPLHPPLTWALVEAWAMTSLAEHPGRPEVQTWLRGWVENEPPRTTLVWRAFLPVRARGPAPTRQEMDAFFAVAAPHLNEKLETESFRVHAWLKNRVRKLVKAAAEPKTHPDDTDTPAITRPNHDDVVAFVVGSANEQKSPLTLRGLEEALKNRRAFERMVAGMTLVMDARLGGLSEDGLLVDTENAHVSTADVEDGWRNDAHDAPLVPFRVRRVRVRQEDHEESDDSGAMDEANEQVGSKDAAMWQPIHAFDEERDEEGHAIRQLVVDKWRGEAPNEDARSISSRRQALAEHQQWAAARAKALVERLGLDGELAGAIVTAARLHDEGKRATRWQLAFHTPKDGRPYAKTGSRKPPDFGILAGYRHELGSLFHLDTDEDFARLPPEGQDLVHHLVAAHHGRARPLIETTGCDEAPPSALASIASDTALRFARLQHRYGPWGLAWLEALVRAADQQASRDLDQQRAPHG